MKITLLLALLSFLLFAFTAKSSSAPLATTDTDIDTHVDTNTETDADADADTEVAAGYEPVVDVSNQKVRANTGYYILAARDQTFKGHGFDQSGNLRGKSCPHYNVVLDIARGSPLKFSHANANSLLVGVSSYLNIEFAKSSGCNWPLVWKVDDIDKETGQWFITTSGIKGSFGDETVRNWFQIVKVGANIYNIIYCPDIICPYCIPKCQNVSYYSHKNAEFLALSADRPFDVQFVKA